MGSVLPVLLEACKSQDANLRQSAVYGIGVLAQYRPEGFAIVAATAITTIVNIINAPDSRCLSHHDCCCCYDSGVVCAKAVRLGKTTIGVDGDACGSRPLVSNFCGPDFPSLS